MDANESRRRFVQLTAIAAVAPLGAARALADNEVAPTPACHDGDAPTVPEIEGPFYKPRSPERSDLAEPAPGKGSRLVELAGFVMTRNCRPVSRILLDLWHADQNGDYDNSGFRYRGHVFTDAEGRYRFRTIMPGPYPGRTRHYHVKVLSIGRQLLTTQLYFPNEPLNLRDDFFHPELLMRTADAGEGMTARFDFVLNLR
jgi:protocatechuate 3,4-dioxygenase beta subunit